MHRHDAGLGQHVVQVGEDRLLHLAGIGRAADQHDLAREVDRDDGLGAAAVPGRVGAEARQVDDGQLRREVGEGLALRADQQVADEQRVPGILGEDPGADPVTDLGTADEILGEQLTPLGMGHEVLEEGVELGPGDGAVVLPPHLVLGVGVADDELVLGRAAGMDAGLSDQGAAGGELGLAALQRVLVEARRLQVPVDALEVAQADLVGAERLVEYADVVHACSSWRRPLGPRPAAGPDRAD